MPWFEPNATQEEIDFFTSRPAHFTHRVSQWPHPNTPRINCRYRVKHTIPTLVPLCHRYGLYYHKSIGSYDPDDAEFNAFGWFDSDIRADNHIGFATSRNDEGYLLDVDIKAYDELPLSGKEGVEFTVLFDHTTFGSSLFHEEYELAVVNDAWRYDMNTFIFSNPVGARWTDVSPAFVQLLKPRLFGVSDCYLFKRLPIGFAAFNGTDAYIKLNDPIDGLNQDFIIELDIRFNEWDQFNPVFGVQGTGGFIGMDGVDLIIGAARRETTWSPENDVWYKWRLEFEQQGQLKYELFVDDLKILSTVTNRLNFDPNTIGVYKEGVSGTLWADADYANLKVWTGDNPSTDVQLDMPLFENALDIGPLGNHGTTFNMDLPSV